MKRRNFLKAAAVGFAALVARAFVPFHWAGAAPGVKRWSGRVVLPHGYTIKAGDVVELDPDTSTTVEASGNIVIYGTLRMRPRTDGVIHTLRFVKVKESSFVGGGMVPVRSDVGLWVMDNGRLDAAGRRKTAWLRAGSVPAGASELQLASAPVGWRKGDEVAITPTLPPNDPNYLTSEVRKIKAVNGNAVLLSSGVTLAHPSVSGPLGDLGPEILNLTRNVRIEGTPTGRSHIFMRPSRPQKLSNVAVRYMGPRKDGNGILGRYGVHFHMAMDGTRGSTVTGIVVRDCNAHAFVPHMSHGITFRQCISFATVDDAYWWDRVTGDLSGSAGINDYPNTITNDTVYDRCVAADITGPAGVYRLNGFSLNRGSGLAVIGCVAVGVREGKLGGGFQWPENNHGIWEVRDCVAHNNSQSGMVIWQNGKDDVSPTIQRFAAYHNRNGIYHGAYSNYYAFEDCWCHGNSDTGILLAVQSPLSISSVYSRCTVDAAGLGDYALRTAPHNFSGGQPTVFDGCRFSGANVACVGIVNSNRKFDLETFNDCTYEGNEFLLASTLAPDSLVEVNDATHGHIFLRQKDQPGTFVPEWNASVEAADSGGEGG